MKWRIINQKNNQKTEEIIKVLLANRGLKKKKEIEEFLNPKKPEELIAKDVGLDSIQIKKAVQRIKKAIKVKEKIIVYGDYDADGVCGTAILWEALHHLGAKVLPFIPKREEGYGLRIDRLEQMAKDGVKLIVTVDQGIIAHLESEKAQKLGLDLIITDHHVLGPKKPKAWAIIHTTQLAGCGVAWFLVQNLYRAFGLLEKAAGLDLAALGTITDLMPLLGANRCLVKYGLKVLSKSQRPGLRALFDFAGLSQEKIGVFEVGFIIGPRLNAAGRMDDPMESLRLICTTDEKRGISLAQKIDQKNQERKDLTKQTALHARESWLSQKSQSLLIFVAHESYQEGVIGLVAGKLVDEFYRPAVVVSQGKEFSKASARSIDELNIIEVIRSCAGILGPHGGHPKAAGFTIQTAKINLLKEKLSRLVQQKLKGQDLSLTLKIDLELDWEFLNLSFYKELMKLEPFGEGNPPPVFLTRNFKVLEIKNVGSEKQHLKLRLGSVIKPSFIIEAIGFGLGDLAKQLKFEQKIEVVYQLLANEWNGQQKLQLKLKDFKIENPDGKEI